jgi:3-keto-disaccharide hydrolase
MIRVLSFVAVSLLTTCAASAAEPETAPAESPGMTKIFNGKDLTGWDGDPRLWSVKDGAIHGETTEENPAKGNTFLIWQGGKTKDFELRLSFRCTDKNNSGIQYRSSHITEGNVRNKWVVRGYQHEIRNEITLPSVAGFIYEEGGKRGRMCLVGEKVVWGQDGKKTLVDTFLNQADFEKLFKLNDWNEVVIIAKGDHLQHFLNGRLIVDCTDDHPEFARRDGILALQLHAGAPMWVDFKDIRIRDLGAR